MAQWGRGTVIGHRLRRGRLGGHQERGAHLRDGCPCSQKCLLAHRGSLLVQLLLGLQHCPKLLVGAELQQATAGILGDLLHLQLLSHTGAQEMQSHTWIPRRRREGVG